MANPHQTEAKEHGKPPRGPDEKDNGTQKTGTTNTASHATIKVIQDATQRVVKQSAEVIRFGLHAVAKVQAPLIEVSEDHSRRLVDHVSYVTDMYYDAAQKPPLTCWRWLSPFTLSRVRCR